VRIKGMTPAKTLAGGALLLAAAACATDTATVRSAAQSPFIPTATIQDLMAQEVDPAADFLWESVGTYSRPDGVEVREPRTDEQWAAVRRQALVLTEAANLLMIDGRHVAAPGKPLEFSGDPTSPTPEQIEAAIAASRESFVGYAQALHAAGTEALGAIDRRDVPALLHSGETIDRACESCHQAYWYPNSPPPD
jgi:hypothetical protein